MTAKDILEQISGILDDDSMIAAAKVYMIKDIIFNEAKEVPFTTPRMNSYIGNTHEEMGTREPDT